MIVLSLACATVVPSLAAFTFASDNLPYFTRGDAYSQNSGGAPATLLEQYLVRYGNKATTSEPEPQLLQADAELQHEAVNLHEAPRVMAMDDAEILETRWLRQRNVALLRQDVALRAEDFKIRREDSELRTRNANMRSEIATNVLAAKNAHRSFAVMVSAREGSGRSARPLVIIAASGIAFFAAIFVFWCDCFGYATSGEESDEDDEEAGLRSMVDRRPGICSCCRCFCNKTVLSFTVGLVVVTFVVCRIAWQTGVLQPILAQFGAYIYICGVIAALIGLLLCEVWRLVAHSVSYIMNQFSKVQNSAEEQAHKWKDKIIGSTKKAGNAMGNTLLKSGDTRPRGWAPRKP